MPFREMPAGQTAAPPGGLRCRFCGAAIDHNIAARRGGACLAPGCESRRIREASEAVLRRDWEKRRDRIRGLVRQSAPAITAAAAAIGQAPEEVPVAVLPRQDRPLVPLPAGRVAAFTEHLDRIIAEAFETPPPEGGESARKRIVRPEDPLTVAACSNCQGYCCLGGNERQAFLTVDTIQSIRRQRPGITAVEVRENHLARLPEEAVEGSCLFHGPAGCTVERDCRADICNSHLCKPFLYIAHDAAIPADGPLVMLSVEDDAAPAIATYTAEDGRALQSPAERPPGEVSEAQAQRLADAVARRIPERPPYPLKGAAPPERTCRWCGAEITVHQQVTTASCGAPPCEHRRIAGTYQR